VEDNKGTKNGGETVAIAWHIDYIAPKTEAIDTSLWPKRSVQQYSTEELQVLTTREWSKNIFSRNTDSDIISITPLHSEISMPVVLTIVSLFSNNPGMISTRQLFGWFVGINTIISQVRLRSPAKNFSYSRRRTFRHVPSDWLRHSKTILPFVHYHNASARLLKIGRLDGNFS
jgi:hypothetical protein